MATNNPIDSLDPIQVALGGTGNATLTANGVIYGNGTGNVGVTSVGTAGQLLTSNGTGIAPTFQTNSSTSAWVLIQTQTASNSANIAFTGISSTYKNYVVMWANVLAATNAVQHQLLFSTNGGSSYLSSGYAVFDAVRVGTSTTNTTSTTYVPLSLSSGTGSMQTGNISSGMVSLYGFGFSAFPSATSEVFVQPTVLVLLGGGYASAITVNAISFQMSSGNITSGTYSLYGLVS